MRDFRQHPATEGGADWRRAASAATATRWAPHRRGGLRGSARSQAGGGVAFLIRQRLPQFAGRAANISRDPLTTPRQPNTIVKADLEACLMFTTTRNSDTAPPPQGEHETTGVAAKEKVTGVGTWFLRNIWYYAVPGKKLRPGQMVAKTILGEPILIGRDRTGKPFALKDICPHQAVPLSKGRFDGWRFDTAGICTAIPSLASGQDLKICNIKTQSYPCTEHQGCVWVFMGDRTDSLPDVPCAPGLEGVSYDQSTVTLLIPTHIDYATAALIDPAHVPYVHNAWWWRSTRNMREKVKRYVPEGNGWTMVRHQPSKHSIAFQLLGNHIETEISFRLPGIRREYLTFGGRTFLSGMSTLTPIDETHTELNHTTFWTVRGLAPVLTPVINYFVREFLGQDQRIARMQEIGLRCDPNLIMTIKDAGTPGHWYFLCKKEWALATSEGREFVNPIKESILRWRS